MKINIPNVLTWLRILAIPLVVGVFYLPDPWLDAYQKNQAATFLLPAMTALSGIVLM